MRLRSSLDSDLVSCFYRAWSAQKVLELIQTECVWRRGRVPKMCHDGLFRAWCRPEDNLRCHSWIIVVLVQLSNINDMKADRKYPFRIFNSYRRRMNEWETLDWEQRVITMWELSVKVLWNYFWIYDELMMHINQSTPSRVDWSGTLIESAIVFTVLMSFLFHWNSQWPLVYITTQTQCTIDDSSVIKMNKQCMW